MPQLSVIVSDHLHQKIIEKGKQFGVDNISETVRILLQSGIENEDLGSSGGEVQVLSNHAINYSIMDHYLLEECLLALVEGGPEMKEKAYAKAKEFVASVSQETS